MSDKVVGNDINNNKQRTEWIQLVDGMVTRAVTRQSELKLKYDVAVDWFNLYSALIAYTTQDGCVQACE